MQHRRYILNTKPPSCVHRIRRTSIGFPSWCPESTHPTDSCFQGTSCEINLMMYSGLYQHTRVVLYMYLTDDLNPVFDLNMTDVNPQMTWFGIVAALPDGGALVTKFVRSNNTEQVLRVNVSGQVIQHVHQCEKSSLWGPVGRQVLNNHLFVIYRNGKLVEININNTNIVQFYQVPNVSWMFQCGSLSYHPSVITHSDLLLLADRWNGEIFSYNVTSNNKQVHRTGLSYPTSVSVMTYNSHLYYVVCHTHQVRVYNSTWGWYKTLGGTLGYGDVQFNLPFSAIGLPDGSVIISDTYNARVSIFTIQGKFVRHILTRSDGLSHTWDMSINLPYLWLTDYMVWPIYRLYRYKLY